MALATADANGLPSVRFVLCKGVDADGIVFYTNTGSRKGEEIAATGRAAATFWWDRLERQVRLEGPTGEIPGEASDAYFASRPHGSRIAAWASPQSRELADRAELERRFADAAARHPVGSEVPRPPFWGGYRLRPLRIEFWQGRESRTHDRIVFTREHVEATTWTTVRLAP
jgi:pyridoxamine 5'-phosphate oxidase